MIAYRSSLPNNRRQKQGQCTTAKKHSMLLPLSSKNSKLSGDTVTSTLLNKNITKKLIAIQAAHRFEISVGEGAVCTLYNSKFVECPRPSANFVHRFVHFQLEMKRTKSV
jgi:hypothetical protein